MKALHSDERCELYVLGSPQGESETKLLLVRSENGRRTAETGRLVDWWAIQSPQLLTVQHVLDAEQAPPNWIAAAVEIRGRCLENENLTEAREGSLKTLFRSMMELVDRSQRLQMYPDFDPCLTWLATDETAICALLPLDGPLPPEVEQVQLAARGFYVFATGIEPSLMPGRTPALLRWSKFGGEELSRIVERCLAPVNPQAAITMLSGLDRALGRKKTNGLSANSSDVPATPQSSAQGRGLDKVAGMHVLKALLRREVVGPIRDPEPYRRYGLSIPNGILLYGPPGCGKTYIARQLAEELGYYFVEIIPSELASPFIHQSVMRIRELFDSAAEQAPAIIFIDEFEALVPSRSGLGGHQQYKAEEVNEFLAHLNGCSEKNIFVIAATNQPDKIDPAVRRTGRLDKLIYVGAPDLEARTEMLSLHLESRPVAADLEIGSLAAELQGYSASDIRFLVDEAARAALKNRQDITQESFQMAMRGIQPSVTTEVETQYRSVEERGS
jgi:AAA+ superfamily predicted ATPase